MVCPIATRASCNPPVIFEEHGFGVVQKGHALSGQHTRAQVGPAIYTVERTVCAAQIGEWLPVCPCARHVALEMDLETVGTELLLVVYNVEALGYDLDAVATIPDVEVRHG